jgi:hypothetical protein
VQLWQWESSWLNVLVMTESTFYYPTPILNYLRGLSYKIYLVPEKFQKPAASISSVSFCQHFWNLISWDSPFKKVQKLYLFFSSLLPAVPRGAGGREPIGDGSGTLEYQLLQRICYAALWVPRAQTTWGKLRRFRGFPITTELLLWGISCVGTQLITTWLTEQLLL